MEATLKHLSECAPCLDAVSKLNHKTRFRRRLSMMAVQCAGLALADAAIMEIFRR